jgi:hypothetical protein
MADIAKCTPVGKDSERLEEGLFPKSRRGGFAEDRNEECGLSDHSPGCQASQESAREFQKRPECWKASGKKIVILSKAKNHSWLCVLAQE